MSSLRINLLGDFCIKHGGEPVTGLDNTRLQSLLAYLVLHRDAAQSRAQLSYLFWLDSSESQARANLRKQIYHLRRALPEPKLFLYTDHKVVQWRPDAPLVLDVDEFETAITEAGEQERAGDVNGLRVALERAVAAYQGDLLPGCYDDWVLFERERLHQQCTWALEQLVQLLESQRAYEAAIHAAQRLLRHDPLHEASYRQLMRLHALNGDRARALRTYHTCATVLQRELDVDPGGAIQDVYERLLSADEPGAPPAQRLAPKASLVGRDGEWVRLQTTWSRAGGGRSQVVLLSGEAGMGKTRLAEELLEWAQRQGLPTASARCYASETGLAYGTVTAWLRSPPLAEGLKTLDDIWLSECARLLPELLVERPTIPAPGPLAEGWQRQRMSQALTRPFLQRRQLLLLLDDVQWCDRETLEWLPTFLRAPQNIGAASVRPAQLLLVITRRSGEMPNSGRFDILLGELRAGRRLTEIELGPLDETETLALASDVAGQALDPALARPLYRGSEGNPLFIVEMVRASEGATSRWMTQHEQEQAQVDLSLPPKVQQVIEARLTQLSSGARELAGVAATIGREFSFNVLAAAGGAEEEASVRAIDELWRRRIVREQGADAYDFAHDMIRRVAYNALSAIHRRFLHRRVAEALLAAHAGDLDPVQGLIARHYELAGDTALAIHHYPLAAGYARSLYANKEAVSYLRRVLGLMPDCDPAARPRPEELYEQLGDLLVLAGKADEACQAYEEALRCLEPDEKQGRAALLCRIGRTGSRQSERGSPSATLEEALRILGPEPLSAPPGWWQTWLDIQYARLSLLYAKAQPGEMEPLFDQMRPVVDEHATPRQRAEFLARQTMVELRKERFVISGEILERQHRALEWAQRSADAGQILSVEFGLGFVLLWSGDRQAAIRQLEKTLPRAEEVGDLPTQTLCLTYLAVVHRMLGDLDGAKLYADRCLQLARAGGSTIYIGAAEANLGWLAYRTGDPDGAASHCKAALDEWQQSHYPFQWLALWPLLAVALDQGRIADAIDRARAMLEPVQQRLPDPLTSALEEAIAAWESGDDEPTPERTGTVRKHLTRAAELARDIGYL